MRSRGVNRISNPASTASGGRTYGAPNRFGGGGWQQVERTPIYQSDAHRAGMVAETIIGKIATDIPS